MITRWKKTTAPAAEALAGRPRPRPTNPGHALSSPPAFNIAACFRSDVGCRRQVNEDCWRLVEPEDVAARAGKGVLALVCDGMGGHAAGEIASRLAAEAVARVYYASAKPPAVALEESLHEANRLIHRAALKNPAWHAMGTTCTALVIHAGAALTAQVGDSRLYLARGGQIYLMSEDHSAVMEMVRRGEMTLEQARRHEDKNIILRALGVQPTVQVATWPAPFPLRDQDCFVLCSDGLYDLVSDEEIKQAVAGQGVEAACEQLIQLARARGGHDNITVGVIGLSLA